MMSKITQTVMEVPVLPGAARGPDKSLVAGALTCGCGCQNPYSKGRISYTRKVSIK